MGSMKVSTGSIKLCVSMHADVLGIPSREEHSSIKKNFVELAISRGVLMEEKDDPMCKCCMEIVTKHINLVQGSLGHKNGFSSNTRETV